MFKKMFLVVGLTGSGLIQSVANHTITTKTGEVYSIKAHNIVTVATLMALMAPSYEQNKQVTTFEQDFSLNQCKKFNNEFYGKCQLTQKKANNSYDLRHKGTIKQPGKR